MGSPPWLKVSNSGLFYAVIKRLKLAILSHILYWQFRDGTPTPAAAIVVHIEATG